MRFNSTLLAACALVLPAAQALNAEEIVGGPYVVNVTSKSATVAWVVKTGEMKVGPSWTGLNRSIPILRSHRIPFTNLKPGTTVHYDVLGGKPEGKGYFKTAPEPGASFEFVVFGDTRTRHELHQKIVDAIVKRDPEIVVHTGDLVSDGTDTELWPIFFNIEKELLKKAAFFPVLGNHERNSKQFYEFFDVSTPYYSFNWGSAHFTILNTDVGNVAISAAAKESFWAEQLKWLEDDLAKSKKAEFRFVVMHHPPFTAVKRRQGDNRLASQTVPLFEKYKVHAVFNGHDHNYQRHVVNGVTYVVTGGGGAPLYPVDAPLPGVTQKVESTEHYVRVRVEPGKAALEVVALAGHVIENVEIKP